MKKDVDQGNQGTMVREDIKGALRDFFPEKSEESLQLLIDAAETELEAKEVETLEYKNLFMEVKNWFKKIKFFSLNIFVYYRAYRYLLSCFCSIIDYNIINTSLLWKCC